MYTAGFALIHANLLYEGFAARPAAFQPAFILQTDAGRKYAGPHAASVKMS
jgi:hypothetical protein